MYKDKFVLSVIHDGYPVKETGLRSKREVAIPFDSEYKIRLKNKNDRSCTARVFVDGKKVSQLGDFIISSGGTVDLERFVDRSLTEGKKFKFVSLDNLDVDDPTSSDNGIIKVEFRLAKQSNGIKIHWEYPPTVFPKDYSFDEIKWKRYMSNPVWTGDTTDSSIYYPDSVTYSANSPQDVSNVRYCASSFVEKGATVEGGRSGQSFIYSNLDVEDAPTTVLKLNLMGLTNRIGKQVKYCSQCGISVRKKDKYCSRCGHRL